MSLKTTIKLDAGTLKRDLEEIARAVSNPEELHREIAGDVAILVDSHLEKNYKRRDKNGITFWADVRKSIEHSGTAKEAEVSLTQLGLKLRYYGGVVTPGKNISSYTGKLTRALAIPTPDVPVDAAAGRYVRPANAGLLAFIRSATRGGTVVGTLVEGMEVPITKGKKKGGKRIVPRPGGKLLYTLKTITRHRADKGILPTEAEIRKTLVDAILNLLEALD